MYSQSVDAAAEVSIKKKNFMKNNFIGYFIASMLAGIFVGFGIILVFSIGAPFAAAGSPGVKLIMGASFGVALTLVVFAGSELFTGNTMYMTFGLMKKKVGILDFTKVLGISWIGNLAGGILLGILAVYGGSIKHALPFFANVSAAKMTAPALELFIRAILCNMLVCLALWTSSRTKSDIAKIFLIFWCLFAFIGAGFEHSIANMSLMTVGLLGNPDTAAISWPGFFYNMLWVTLGNFVGGAIFIAGSYLLTNTEFKK